MLGMPVRDEAWHEEDIKDECNELYGAIKFIDRWSEYSDVVYAVVRARKDGYDVKFPLARRYFIYGSMYMFPKYTLRYLFYRQAGRKAGACVPVHEVRNPKKAHKLHHIAGKYDIDPVEFEKICVRQLRYWLLLK